MDLSNVNKNIDAIVEDLAKKCQKIFFRGSGASSRSAIVSFDSLPRSEISPEQGRYSPEGWPPFPFRERTVLGKVGVNSCS